MRRRHVLGLMTFCLVTGSRWLVEEAWPETLPPLLGQALHYAVICAAAFLFLTLRKREVRKRPAHAARLAAAGLLLLGLPFLLQQFASAVRAETTVALYAFVPLCVVVAGASTQNDASRAPMMPALAGLAGILLLLPWRPPSTAAESIAIGLVLTGVMLTAIGGVWTYSLAPSRPLMESVAIIALANAVVLGVASVIRGERLALLTHGDHAALGIALPQAFLLVWLVCEIAPERLASRFLLVPLVTLVEGAVLLHAHPDGRTVVAVLLILFGAGTLLWGKRESDVSLGLR